MRQALNWNAGSVDMGTALLRQRLAVRLEAVARGLQLVRPAARPAFAPAARRGDSRRRSNQLRRVSFVRVSFRRVHASYLCSSASSAAFSMTARGAVSPVQISNWRTACSMNISRPGTTVLPCSRACRISTRLERIVDHVEHHIRRECGR